MIHRASRVEHGHGSTMSGCASLYPIISIKIVAYVRWWVLHIGTDGMYRCELPSFLPDGMPSGDGFRGKV